MKRVVHTPAVAQEPPLSTLSAQKVCRTDTSFLTTFRNIGWPDGHNTLRNIPNHRGNREERPSVYPIFLTLCQEHRKDLSGDPIPNLTGKRGLEAHRALSSLLISFLSLGGPLCASLPRCTCWVHDRPCSYDHGVPRGV